MRKFPYRDLSVDKGWIRLIALAYGVSAIACAQVNVLTANYDNSRTNANLQETVLTPASVQWTPSSTFGKLATFPVDGQIFAQPLYVSGVQIAGQSHNVVYVVTMHDSVYAIDADNLTSSTPLWQVNFGPSVPSGLFNFTDILPEVGILSTPVIDTSAQVIYVVSDTLAVSPPGETVFQLHALSLADGHEMMNGPVTITATVPGTGDGTNNGSITFDPSQQLQRPGLALLNGTVYIGFGSHDDAGAYHGWLMSYDASNLQHPLAVFNASPNGAGDAIWQSGRAPAFDGNGNLFVITGNGDYDGISNFGESALRLSAADLKLQDWYTPQEWSTWNIQDYDLGSSGPLLIPNSNLMVTAGKAGMLYLLQTGSLGHLGPDNTSTVQGVQVTQSSVFTMALWATQSSPIVYEFEAGGALRAFQIANGTFNPTELSEFDPPASSVYAGLAVSANGATDGTGIVWITTGDYSTGAVAGTLHALDASNLANELWNSDMSGTRDTLGRLAKFVAPTVANGRVYVPTFSNTLVTYGLLPNGQPQPGAPQIAAVVNGASYLTTPVSPGELVTIYGANFGPLGDDDGQVDAGNRVTASLSSAQVLFNNLPAPLLYASAGQFDVVVPFGVVGPTTQIQVLYQGQVMASTTVPVQASSPAFFALDGSGGGQGAILNQDGTVNTRDNPAPRGSYVVLYATGGGLTNPPSVDGAITGTAPPFPLVTLPVSVYIGDQQANVVYAGAAPGIIAGVLQINIQIPESADPSFADQLTLKIGGYVSPTAITIAVQ